LPSIRFKRSAVFLPQNFPAASLGAAWLQGLPLERSGPMAENRKRLIDRAIAYVDGRVHTKTALLVRMSVYGRHKEERIL
jgi:hypothetical protein